MLVARGLSLFLEVDAAAVPPKQRPGFVALQVRRAAPFADPEHDLVWFGDRAAVWYWSRGRIAELLGSSAPRTRIRAEACFRGSTPASTEPSLELLDLRVPSPDGGEHGAGVEVRLWRRGHLASSRWWPALPADSQWQAFLRGSGLDPTLPCPEPEPCGLRKQPLDGGGRSLALAGQVRAQWPTLASAAGALMLALFAWQLAGVGRAYSDIGQLESRVAALENHLTTVISARGRADDAAARIDALMALRPPASQTRLLGELARVTPGSGWQLLKWEQPSPEILEVTLRGTGLDVTAIVNAWEQSPLLQDVTPTSGSRADELTLRARLASTEQTP